jgi:pyruvate dehydrogenase E2 component (dihydrolipoamide acetyltransferase)
MHNFKDVVTRARSGKLRSSELSDPTITITSLGERGVDEVLPVIIPPQVAMIGFGRIADRPWVAEGAVVVRPLVRASLVADHRVANGHDASRFLLALERLLAAPEAL